MYTPPTPTRRNSTCVWDIKVKVKVQVHLLCARAIRHGNDKTGETENKDWKVEIDGQKIHGVENVRSN